MSNTFCTGVSPEEVLSSKPKKEEDLLSVIKEVYANIEAGMRGENKGISFGIPKLDKYLYGITRGTYTLIISTSGGGKTSFSLYAYIYKPLMEHLEDDNFKCTYFTLEMSKVDMLTKLLSIYIYERYHKVFSYSHLLSISDELSKEDHKIIKESEPWLKKLVKKLEFIDDCTTADSIEEKLKERIEEGSYDQGLTHLVVIDHIGLIQASPGRTLKQEMDRLSRVLVTYRNNYSISPLVMQQANRSSDHPIRKGEGFSLSDSKDSGNTVNDCDVMLGIYDPQKDNLTTFSSKDKSKKYDLIKLQGRFRLCQILKNRKGPCNKEIPLLFYGEINTFKPMPDIEELEGRYEDYASLNTELMMNGS